MMKSWAMGGGGLIGVVQAAALEGVPAQETPAAAVDVTNLEGTISAQDWFNPDAGQGAITAVGTYDTKVNTPTKSLIEDLHIFLSMTITYTDGHTQSGGEFGLLATVNKAGLVGTSDPNVPFEEPMEYELVGDEAKLDAATKDAASELSLKDPKGGGGITEMDVHTMYNKAVSARVKVRILGAMRGGKAAVDSIDGKATLSFDKSGNSIKAKSVQAKN
ncbi:MAG: hypothetical protein HYY17_02835 [Planctomycetes bacterium]|nr:hypothetical protein [Planctomycetota bacterium]